MPHFRRILPHLLLPELYTVPALAAREYENPYLRFTAPEGWHIEDQGVLAGRRTVRLGPPSPDGKGASPAFWVILQSGQAPLADFSRFAREAEDTLLEEAMRPPVLMVSRLYSEKYCHAGTPCVQVTMERVFGGTPVLVDMWLLFDAGERQTLMRACVGHAAEAEHTRDYIDIFLPSLRFTEEAPA